MGIHFKSSASNVEFYDEDGYRRLTIMTDGDSVAWYTDPHNHECAADALEEYEKDIRAKIKKAFPNEDESEIDDAVRTVLNNVDIETVYENLLDVKCEDGISLG